MFPKHVFLSSKENQSFKERSCTVRSDSCFALLWKPSLWRVGSCYCLHQGWWHLTSLLRHYLDTSRAQQESLVCSDSLASLEASKGGVHTLDNFNANMITHIVNSYTHYNLFANWILNRRTQSFSHHEMALEIDRTLRRNQEFLDETLLLVSKRVAKFYR